MAVRRKKAVRNATARKHEVKADLANFEGSCRTFGPGDYPNLPSDLDHRISSGRRIADRYPYEGRPTWSR